MIKRIFGTMTVVIVMFVGNRTYNVQNEMKLTKVSITNIEALAEGEIIIGPWYCYGDTDICHIDEHGVVFGRLYYF